MLQHTVHPTPSHPHCNAMLSETTLSLKTTYFNEFCGCHRHLRGMMMLPMPVAAVAGGSVKQLLVQQKFFMRNRLKWFSFILLFDWIKYLMFYGADLLLCWFRFSLLLSAQHNSTVLLNNIIVMCCYGIEMFCFSLFISVLAKTQCFSTTLTRI